MPHHRQALLVNHYIIQTMYTIGQTNPLTESDIQNIELLTPVPIDYKQFLRRYGFGSVNEVLMITQPDEQYIKLNFGDYLHLWNLTAIE